MMHIKSVKEAEETISKGEHMYLITFVSNDKLGSFVLMSVDEKPLWKIYYILQEQPHSELRKYTDPNGLLCITNIVKLS